MGASSAGPKLKSAWASMWSCCWIYRSVSTLELHCLDSQSIAGLGYVKYIAPPEWALRWLESKLDLLAILPHFVSVDQKTYGRFGVLPSINRMGGSPATELVGSTQRLGP
ncbi:hypothetical protein ARSEF1564_010005 [Beauveria bassiana]